MYHPNLCLDVHMMFSLCAYLCVQIPPFNKDMSHIELGKWRGTKDNLEEGEKREWKNWLKIQHTKNEDRGIQSHHFMANRRGIVETMTDFVFSGSKITTDSDYSHEIKIH